MKRLIPLFVGLVLVSCDSGTKEAEGTSSETQTALQALADNVREIPRGPGGGGMPNTPATAGRVAGDLDMDCRSTMAWTEGGWLQAEFYDGHNWMAGVQESDSAFSWLTYRNELATDEHGDALPGWCPTGPMRTRASNRWRARNGEQAVFEGLFRRDRDSGGMTSVRWEGLLLYPSGFQLRSIITQFGSNLLLEPDTSQEWAYSFGEDRYGFRFRFSLGQDGTSWQQYETERDSIACAAILDHATSDRRVGSVCGTRSLSRWTIRDANGNVVPPRGTTMGAIDDSMGVRILSTGWDGDRLRIRFRVRTAPFALRQWSRTTLFVGDSLESHKSPLLRPYGKEWAFPDTNFVGPEDGELSFAAEELANRSILRVELKRVYRRPAGDSSTIGIWRLPIPSRDP